MERRRRRRGMTSSEAFEPEAELFLRHRNPHVMHPCLCGWRVLRRRPAYAAAAAAGRVAGERHSPPNLG